MNYRVPRQHSSFLVEGKEKIETRLADQVGVDKGNKVIVIRLSERLYTIEPLEVIDQTPKGTNSNLVS